MGLHEGLMIELPTIGGENINCCVVCPFFVKTSLFVNAYQDKAANAIMNVISPVLTPDYVAEKIVNGIINRERYVVIPQYLYYLVHIVKLLPYPIFDFITKLVVFFFIFILILYYIIK